MLGENPIFESGSQQKHRNQGTQEGEKSGEREREREKGWRASLLKVEERIVFRKRSVGFKECVYEYILRIKQVFW